MRSFRSRVLSGVLATLFVAVTVAVVFHTEAKITNTPFNKFATDPDAAVVPASGNALARIGNVGEAPREPRSVEDEKYANRAYPAREVPFALTERARSAYSSLAVRARSRTGSWTLVGPSTAVVPEELSVYGAGGEQYFTSGRVTSLAIGSSCTARACRLLVGAAGGGIWRTNLALADRPPWEFVSEELGTNAIGSLLIDPNDPTGNTIYAGTGEANASSDSAAGVGLYKSTDGGSTWTIVGTSASVSYARAIAAIAIDPSNPNTIYISTTRAVRGVASVSGGASATPPVAAALGVYKTTDGGATWNQVWNGNNALRGVRRVKIDPTNPNIVYAAAYQQGLWRSLNGGSTWEQIFAPTSPGLNTNRTEFDVTLKDGHTRVYIADGAQGAVGANTTYSQVFRADSVETTSAATLIGGGSNSGWTSLTSNNPSDPRYGTYDFCTGQCWYDAYITTPPGFPDVVYVGGSHQYGETYGLSNGRGVVFSDDAGASFADMTVEAGDVDKQINLHPDHHFLVTHPTNPNIFFSASDGGVVRSSGVFANSAPVCASRGLSGAQLTGCQQLLSRVPTKLTPLNRGLSTLQFQSLSVDPRNWRNLIGGTQDNGTWQNFGSTDTWGQVIYGDGGQSGFDVGKPGFRFNTFFNQAIDANFRNGDPSQWVVISGPLYASGETAPFYVAVIGDPRVSGTMFIGLQSIWRTKNNGGDQAHLEANCSEFTTAANNPNCGDWVRMGTALLTSSTFGADRTGGTIAAVERTASNSSTLWTATSTGRVFISTSADAEPASSVTFTRLDSLASNAPNRFVSSIVIDPANSNRAWISYGGYSALTAATPGHVFEVVYNPGAGTATWTNLDGANGGPLGDLPVTDLARDHLTGDLYASTDFGVHVRPNSSTSWSNAGTGMPMVEVAGLTIVPGDRVLYAATHGRSAWRLSLPRIQ